MTAVVMGLFGLLTVVGGGSVLLNAGGARADAGSIVPVVLWMNFFARSKRVNRFLRNWM